MNEYKFLIMCLLCILSFACSKKDVYVEFDSFTQSEWNKNEIAKFEVEINDTITPYDILIAVRNNDLYEYRNLWLFVRFETPYGSVRNDTLNCELADEFGKWHGQGISLYEMEFPYEQSVVFPRKGRYICSIRQGMREDTLGGISDIGIRVTRSQE